MFQIVKNYGMSMNFAVLENYINLFELFNPLPQITTRSSYFFPTWEGV